MMPLTLANIGEENMIVKIAGKDSAKKFLADLGFVEGAFIRLISENPGGIIVNIKGTRVAISKEMAVKIMI